MALPEGALPDGTMVYRIDGPFFFGAAEKLERTLERMPMGIHTMVLRLGRVPFMDATGLQTLTEVIERFRRRHVRVLLCGVHPRLADQLRLAGVLDLLGDDPPCTSMAEVAERIARPRTTSPSADSTAR
jgi:SulP family sulfate permease